jgi:isoprenylcysteine carboxyl methyltransferase (ICMT) family protein YpbQ
VSHQPTAFVGLLCYLAALPFISRLGLPIVEQSALAMLAAMLPIVTLDLAVNRVHHRASTGLVWEGPARIAWSRVGVKFVGLIATFVAIALVYWLFREYHDKYYQAFWLLCFKFGPFLLALSVPYIALVDARMRNPHDAYWHLGCFMLGRWEDVDRHEIAEHFRGWAVKAFFLPLMFVFLTGNTAAAQHWLGDLETGFTFLKLFNFLINLLYSVDVVFGAAGYVLTLRVLDSHIRWAEPTVLGWFVALLCYPPFWSFTAQNYLEYATDNNWSRWLAETPALQVVWGSIILALTTYYVWATVIFGCRFSNLTHRGIITNGPYRYTKHPAYISKNISWWMLYIPFIPHVSAADTVRNCCLLLLVNLIYFMRAKTEERHLSQDPAYLAYAAWMERHGIFRHVVRALPFLRYAPPPLAPGRVSLA